jgi:hypothetical protein
MESLQPCTPTHAHRVLKDALKEQRQDRFEYIRCVLANYGDLLRLTMEDTARTIADHDRRRARRSA